MDRLPNDERIPKICGIKAGKLSTHEAALQPLRSCD